MIVICLVDFNLVNLLPLELQACFNNVKIINKQTNKNKSALNSFISTCFIDKKKKKENQFSEY